MKRKKAAKVQSAEKRDRGAGKRSYPDNDPEWENLETRYSQINDDMRKLASLFAAEGENEEQP